MNKKSFFRKALTFSVIIAILIIISAFAGCKKENDIIEHTNTVGLKKTKKYYETLLKNEVNALLFQEGLLEESFIIMHGWPMWEKMQWEYINSNNIIVLPLISNGENKKCIVSVVIEESITTFITELSSINVTEYRIFSLNNELLYDSSEIVISISRLKKCVEEASKQSALDLLLDGGNAQNLYKAANGSNAGYNGNLNAGTMCIMSNATGSGSSGNISGHSWLTFSDTFGSKMTFGTWGYNPHTDSYGKGYYVNGELSYSGSKHCVTITYNQLQSLLDYNSKPGNKNWNPVYNCAGYATGAWYAVTGQSIGSGSIITPSHVKDWINNQ